jgi:hypothetical protein
MLLWGPKQERQASGLKGSDLKASARGYSHFSRTFTMRSSLVEDIQQCETATAKPKPKTSTCNRNFCLDLIEGEEK